MAKLTEQRLRQIGNTGPWPDATIDDDSGQSNGANGNSVKFHPSTQWG